MKLLWPSTVDDADAVAAYAGDERPPPAHRPWVLVNMIASADGSAADATGLSGGLGGPADKAVLSAIRAVADVIVAGAATVIAEDYGPGRPSAAVRQMRLGRGQATAPRIAMVTASLAIEPDHRLFREAAPEARPIVLTVDRADPARRRALDAVAEVHTTGHRRVDWHRAIATLHQATGAQTVLCEGGPRTVGQLIADDLVDELCLTVAPTLVAGPGSRIAQAPLTPTNRGLALDRVLVEDGFLFLRYVRDRVAG